jgi:hypothetical protein
VRKNNAKWIAFLMLLPLFLQTLAAEDQPNDRTYTSSSGLTLQVSTLPEMKLSFTERFSFPFLQGESPLTQDNNVGLALGAEVSPISINGIVEAVWTPIAFFQFAAGGRIGSGWKINLFGSDIYGIGLNLPDIVGRSAHDGSAFDGLLWKAQTGGTLQFDLAALFPGDWHHVVAQSYHEINYKGYTRAKAGESWYYENDDGENINGFNYYGNLLIGYQLPLFFNLAALLAEADLYLYDTPYRERWGEDKIRWTYSGILGFTFAKQLDLNLIAQFRTRRNFQESDWQDLYYRNRNLDSSTPIRLKFYRVAAALTYRF